MNSSGSPFDSFPELLMVPLLFVAFVCSAIGSFVIWRVRCAMREHVPPFSIHQFHGEHADVKNAALACALGLLALALPISLLIRAAAG